MAPFYGRESELNALKKCQNLSSAQLVVVKGRRRIGKSSLINEFAKSQNYYQFTGLAPTKQMNAQDQRDEFARLLSEQCQLPRFQLNDWGDLLSLLAREVSTKRAVILLDEISWMADKDETFLSKLKTAWDLYFKRNPKIMLVLCGSVSTWIEENIVSSTAFLGRPTLEMTLKELPLNVCKLFWRKYQERISGYEKLKFLSVTGGIPRYLELMQPNKSAEYNINHLCFSKEGILVKEFDRIFSDTFGARSIIYRDIVKTLVKKSLTLNEIMEVLGRSKSGDISVYMRDLICAGFVQRDFTWKINTGDVAKHSKFRLSDNYVRFYLKYIEPNKEKINLDIYKNTSLCRLSGIESILGLQFENLVINNKEYLFRQLNISLEDIVFANPYFQTKTQKTSGCQIDYMVQTKYNTVYIFEMKFSKNPVGMSVIAEVEEKISRLKLPKHFSYRTILIHGNRVTSELLDEGYFNAIIDFSEILS